MNLISQERGGSNIDQLASIACLSRKQLERLFSGRIGTSPRQFMNIVRFQNAIGYKARYPECNFTSLAFHCGFYDQPHMNHEFKKMSGLTPREFFAGNDSVSDYFCQGE
ncbi:MAG: helix-turn-helix domain-containing protein [Marinilabiliaceae bacterium]